jgi:hypothetical protein
MEAAMSITSVSSAVYHLPAQRTIAHVEPRKVMDMPPEVQEGIRARQAEHEVRYAESQRRLAEAEAQRLQAAKNEVWYQSEPNVASLTREQSLQQIESMTHLIQSGDADKLNLVAANGDKTTNNYRQYVYWLQQHVKELEDTPQSTLAQA